MNFRFRKSFDLLPPFLKGTISKKGVSLNFKAGIFSRSWGTRGTSTTVDVPGTTGMFWRGEKRRKKGGEEGGGATSSLWGVLCWFLICVQFLAGLVYIYILPGLADSCAGGGFTKHLVYMAALALAYTFATVTMPRLRGPLGVLALLAAFWLQWVVYHAMVMPACA